MKIKRSRKAFTIVELVIVIAVIAILATVLVPTFDEMINKAKDSKAMQEAKNAYTSYMVENAGKGEMPELFLYKAEEGRVVALLNGAAVGVYESEGAALTALGLKEDAKLTNTGDGKLFAYGGEVTVPNVPGASTGFLSAPTADTIGKSFSKTEEWMVSKDLSDTPLTYETWIKLPVHYATGESSRGGIILGNYCANYGPGFSFEIAANGNPKLYYIYDKDSSVNVTFDEVTVNTGEWLHLAIVNDYINENLVCYVNGVAMQSIAQKVEPVSIYATPKIGNDYRENPVHYFKGEIHSVAVYGDVRTADKIAADKETYGKDHLIAAWDVSGGNAAWIEDVSGNGHDVSLPKIFSKEYAGTILDQDLSGIPLTYEAWINLPGNAVSKDTRGGVILGNYTDKQFGAYFSFEIAEYGWPKLYYMYGESDAVTVIFNKVSANTGKWTHISIVNDTANKQFVCYIDGEARQTISYNPNDAQKVTKDGKDWYSIAYTANSGRTDASPITTYTKPMIGNDYRKDPIRYFRGKIRYVAVYSDVRPESKIKADMVSYNGDNLIAAWNLRQATADGVIRDISGNGHSVNADWIAKKSVADYAYSFAVVGDTQSVNIYDPDNFAKIYDWIVANKDAENIRYVMGLGDITDKDQNAEWERAAAAFDGLNTAAIPYSVVIGNHDGVTNTKDIANFNNFVGTDSYKASLGGTYDGNMDHTYRIVEIGGRKYLIFALGFGANDEILSWASGVISENQDCNVIITTHAYMFRDGTTLSAGDVCPPTYYGKDRYGLKRNNGDDMWNKLISKHSNIVMVLSGHDPHPYIVAAHGQGDHGNKVMQILTDHQYVDRDLYKAGQDTTGMVTMLYFSADGKTVTVACYSTVYEMYYNADNQFVLELNVIG